MRTLTRKVLQTIHRYQLLKEGDRVIVALSGGPDSVALLLALRELEESLSLRLCAAHLNHRLRGSESDQDEQFVRRLCHQFGLPIEVKGVNTKQEMRKSGENLESCARRLRYSFLSQLAQEEGSRVATGHTLNDQAETFLMKLVRGAGPGGLSGICPLRVNQFGTPQEPLSVTVVRPLLEVAHQEVLDFLADHNQSYRVDSSNQDLSFDRNWVRHQLIPLLKEKLNPALLETFQRTTELFREVEEFLAQHGKEAFERCRLGEYPETRLPIKELGDFPAIIAKEVVRHAVAAVKGDLRDINLKHIEEILRVSRTLSGKETHLPGGLKVQREFGELRFTLESPPGFFSYQLKVPGEIYVREVAKHVVARRGKREGERERNREIERGAAVVIQWSGESLTIRNRRPGDVYRTSSDAEGKKLKELFQKNRIPKSRRDKLVIVEGDNEIIWVEGFPAQPKYRASPSTARTVEIQVRNETSDREKLLKEGEKDSENETSPRKNA